jgi:hypothetical protein
MVEPIRMTTRVEREKYIVEGDYSGGLAEQA